ncbi:unnamed protein product [Cyprideis torosa]|uniref:Uncharacterized protein n=1 Tax=Cyprideis torosa TaxID=163714 RepID=A0A7R8W670_9CRUS|nr:unnamed protein product [Cyprideis torosa]CAG0881449.1 unnamed protein product [Cyprideis torosa]
MYPTYYFNDYYYLNDYDGTRNVQVFMGPGDTRFGFSVIGGCDEGFMPIIDEISEGSNGAQWVGVGACDVAIEERRDDDAAACLPQSESRLKACSQPT